MTFVCRYPSPVGELLLTSDGNHLTGLWLEGQKYYAAGIGDNAVAEENIPVFLQTKCWLDGYFAGEKPVLSKIPLRLRGSEFRREIWSLLMEISYGEVTTYGQLAARYEQRTGKKTAARAVGGAVGHNPISIIVPCHRVVGVSGTLTGYAGGLDNKRFLLELEHKNIRG